MYRNLFESHSSIEESSELHVFTVWMEIVAFLGACWGFAFEQIQSLGQCKFGTATEIESPVI